MFFLFKILTDEDVFINKNLFQKIKSCIAKIETLYYDPKE